MQYWRTDKNLYISYLRNRGLLRQPRGMRCCTLHCQTVVPQGTDSKPCLGLNKLSPSRQIIVGFGETEQLCEKGNLLFLTKYIFTQSFNYVSFLDLQIIIIPLNTVNKLQARPSCTDFYIYNYVLAFSYFLNICFFFQRQKP